MLIPKRLCRKRSLLQASLQQQGVLARVDVVASSPSHLVEAESLVETPGLDVARAHLEERTPRALGAMVGQQRAEEEPADSLAASRWVHCQVGHVHLVRDHPEAQVTDDRRGSRYPTGTFATRDPQARDPISLQLVEERLTGPRGTEGHALDLEN